jgi:hypothetical protein
MEEFRRISTNFDRFLYSDLNFLSYRSILNLSHYTMSSKITDFAGFKKASRTEYEEQQSRIAEDVKQRIALQKAKKQTKASTLKEKERQSARERQRRRRERIYNEQVEAGLRDSQGKLRKVSNAVMISAQIDSFSQDFEFDSPGGISPSS